MLSSYCITVFLIAVCANIIYASKSNELSEEEAFLAQMKAIPPTIYENFNNFVNDDSAYEQYQKRSTTEMSEGESQRDIRSPLGTMRFGKRSPLGTMRFGKRNPLGTMRFGKRDLSQYDFIKRNPLGTMRFGKRSAFVDF